MFIEALLVAVEAHGKQKRRYTDKPYVMHPIRVADILSQHEHPEVLVHSKPAAVMHDVLEDTAYSENEMRAMFGPHVTDLVKQVTNVTKPEDGDRATRHAITVAHLARILPAAKSIKLADIIDNVSNIVDVAPKDYALLYLSEKADVIEVLKNGGNPGLYSLASERVARGLRILGAN